jgi:hypothetical protein
VVAAMLGLASMKTAKNDKAVNCNHKTTTTTTTAFQQKNKIKWNKNGQKTTTLY